MHPSHGHNQSIVNGISRIGYMKGGKSALWKDDQIADELINKAVSFIENHKDEPFFLYLPRRMHMFPVYLMTLCREIGYGAERRCLVAVRLECG